MATQKLIYEQIKSEVVVIQAEIIMDWNKAGEDLAKVHH